MAFERSVPTIALAMDSALKELASVTQDLMAVTVLLSKVVHHNAQAMEFVATDDAIVIPDFKDLIVPPPSSAFTTALTEESATMGDVNVIPGTLELIAQRLSCVNKIVHAVVFASMEHAFVRLALVVVRVKSFCLALTTVLGMGSVTSKDVSATQDGRDLIVQLRWSAPMTALKEECVCMASVIVTRPLEESHAMKLQPAQINATSADCVSTIGAFVNLDSVVVIVQRNFSDVKTTVPAMVFVALGNVTVSQDLRARLVRRLLFVQATAATTVFV